MNPQECLSRLEEFGLTPIDPQEMADRMVGLGVACMRGELSGAPPAIKGGLMTQLPEPQIEESQRDFTLALPLPKNSSSSEPSV